ncbi:translation elongation factor 4 [Bradymonas sediminis]|uniref:Elongation factor 4 n=1 Tax=Bradymonas sediminis TaxID=1548548 RepID=A0A2Z4FP61_9DELT|nr:translation elongation factor 4 [Bradymonas sediminis]AWV90536.1 elongation factor 4 [Bradymonas sediminis]TDP72069.1 GTP-binding protein LepA [Bradymonas sediminis]
MAKRKIDQSKIRNFSIIAHIDHGKSTLADRILDETRAIASRDKKEQYLDSMDLERERGITIKAQSVRLEYEADDGETYLLNLIDTPGHVDFTYEVSRSLQACEGAILVVDASQGVEAQTVANVYLALDADLEIIPVLNKIDLPAADIPRVKADIEDTIGLDATDAVCASAKNGIGIHEILEAIVKQVPPPVGDVDAPLKALVFDSWFDTYRGVINLVRVVEGELRKGQQIKWMASGARGEIDALGTYTPAPVAVDRLGPGEVGFVITMIKDIGDAKVGDTITEYKKEAAEPLPGFKDVMPMVFCGFYPVDSSDYTALKDALEKLTLNDSSITHEPETSQALGFGYRCGFLGLLHMEIIQERLEREYGLDLITTAPSVIYRVHTEDGETLEVENPCDLPDAQYIDFIEEPYLSATIHVPPEHIGPVLKLCEERRGTQVDMRYAGENRIILTYEIPMNEVMYNFYDRLKSCSRGYASLDYEVIDYRRGDLVKLDVLVNKDVVDALSVIVHRDFAFERGKSLTKKLKKVIHQQLFEIPIQAAIGSRVVARETIRALRKNVTAKCYGGDISRKRKLLERQKEGKKRMKMVGSVEIPQEAFLAVLSIDEE